MRYLFFAFFSFAFFVVAAGFIMRVVLGDMLGDFELDSDEE